MPRGSAQQRGIDFEKYVAEKLGGKLQPGSGNKFYAKNDVIANGLSISCKSQKLYTWAEIIKYLYESVDDTNGTGNIPCLAINEVYDGGIIIMKISDFVKAFENEVKIENSVQGKGIVKREEAEIPLMLR